MSARVAFARHGARALLPKGRRGVNRSPTPIAKPAAIGARFYPDACHAKDAQARVGIMKFFHNGPIRAAAQLSEPNGTQMI